MHSSNDDDFVSVTISAESKRILDQYTLSGEITGATLRSDGRYDVRLQHETLEGLGKLDPDIDAAIASLEDQVQRSSRKQ